MKTSFQKSLFSFLTLIALLANALGVMVTPVSAAGPLVGHWSFENNLLDQSSNGYDATLNLEGTSYPAFSTDVPSGGGAHSMQFDGNGGHVDATTGSEIVGNHSFTVSFWMKYQPTVSRQWVMIIGDLSTYGGLLWLIEADGTASFGYFNGTSNRFNITAYQSQWAKVTTTYDSITGTLTTYLNGAEVDSDVVGSTPALVHGGMVMGKTFFPESHFSGLLDEVKIQDFVDAPGTPVSTIVTNTNDSGAGSLRQVMADAPAGSTITFDSNLSGQTIRLASMLTIDKNLTIDGSELASKITISGDTNGDTNGDVRPFMVNSGITATLDSLIVTKGMAASGGGLYSDGGYITIKNSVFSYNNGNVGINDGGGVRVWGGTLTIDNSTFEYNYARNGAGVLYGGGGTLTVTNSTFSNNTAYGGGGGLMHWASGSQMTLTNSTFAGNQATGSGAGFLTGAGATGTVANSTFYNNDSLSYGGGIAITGDWTGTATLTIKNATLSENSAPNGSGGGIYNGGVMHYSNVISANSTTGGDCVNAGSISTNAKNLVEDGGCYASLSGDPKLNALASNGGLTQTMSLQAGSPALGAGSASVCAAAPVSNFDQRGQSRPQGDFICDIGAYESGENSVIPVTVTADSKTITYGESEPAFTFTSNPVITFDVNPVCSVSGAHTNAGSYTIVCSGGSAAGYQISSYFNATFTVNKATPTLSVTNSPVMFDGQPHTAAVEGSVDGVVSNVLMDGAASQTLVGTYAVTANFAPTDGTNYKGLNGASAGNFVISDDVTAPTVLSSVRASINNTNAVTVDFTVTFSESVTGVDTSDFFMMNTGITGGSITSVTGSGTTYTVTVNTGSGNGTIRLDVLDNDSILDVANNPLGAAFNTGEEYTILKTTPKPSIPVLVAPATGAMVNTLQPTLDWNDTTPLADHYQVQVATNSTFTALVINLSNVTASQFAPDFALQPGKLYYWRVKAFNIIGGANGWSAYRAFKTPLAQPNLVSPINAESLLTDRPAFDWDSVPGATRYVFQVSTTNNFSTLLVNIGQDAADHLVVQDLPQNKTLYWRVQARTATVIGPWSATGSFKSGNPASVPVLLAPANAKLITDLTPLFDWKDSVAPAGSTLKHYEIEVDNNADFSNPVIDTTSTVSTFTPVLNLASNTKFYWRVRVVNTITETGLDHVSGWSPVWTLRTVIAEPTGLSVVATVNPLRPSFDWLDTPAPITGYTIQISTSANFSTLLINATVPTSAYSLLKDLPNNRTIYWRVRVNGTKGPSAWTTGQFSTPVLP